MSFLERFADPRWMEVLPGGDGDIEDRCAIMACRFSASLFVDVDRDSERELKIAWFRLDAQDVL